MGISHKVNALAVVSAHRYATVIDGPEHIRTADLPCPDFVAIDVVLPNESIPGRIARLTGKHPICISYNVNSQGRRVFGSHVDSAYRGSIIASWAVACGKPCPELTSPQLVPVQVVLPNERVLTTGARLARKRT